MGRPKGSRNKNLMAPENQDRRTMAVQYLRLKKQMTKCIEKFEKQFHFRVAVVAQSPTHDKGFEHWPGDLPEVSRQITRKIILNRNPVQALEPPPANVGIDEYLANIQAAPPPLATPPDDGLDI